MSIEWHGARLLRVALVVVGFFALFVVISDSFSFQDSDRNDYTSDRTILREDAAAFDGQGGAKLFYGTHGVRRSLEVITYVGPRRPPAGGDDAFGEASRRRVIGRRLTATGQLVLISIHPASAHVSASTLERVMAAIRPITAHDIDELPESRSVPMNSDSRSTGSCATTSARAGRDVDFARWAGADRLVSRGHAVVETSARFPHR